MSAESVRRLAAQQLNRLLEWLIRAPGRALGLALLVVALAAWPLASLRVETDFLALLPAHDPEVTETRRTLESFGATDTLLLALELPPEPDPAFEFAELLAQEVRGLEAIAGLEYRLDEIETAARELLPLAPLLADPVALDLWLTQLSNKEGLARAARELRARLDGPLGLGSSDWWRADPFGMAQLAFGRFSTTGQLDRFDRASGYLVDREHKWLLLIARPKKAPADLEFSRTLMVDLEKAKARAAATWQLDHQGDPPPTHFVGGHAVAVADAATISRDLMLGTVSTLVAVALIFVFAFGRWQSLAIAFVPLLIGLILTAALAALCFGRLNVLTGSFAAFLIGLGIDFVIVFYARYSEERRAGLEHARALKESTRTTGPGIVIGAVTTAATFFVLFVSDFPGLKELGFLTGAGILILLPVVFWLMPSLLSVQFSAPSSHQLRSFGAIALYRFSCHRPRLVLVLGLFMTAVLAVVATQLRYEDDALRLRSADSPQQRLQRRLVNAFDLRLTPLLVRVDGRSEEELLQHTAAALKALEPLVGTVLARLDSSLVFVPTFVEQRRNLDRLQMAPPREDWRNAAEHALLAAGFNPAAFAEGLDNTEKALARKTPFGPIELAQSRLGPWIERSVRTDGERFSALISCFPPAEAQAGKVPSALRAALVDLPETHLVGPIVLSERLKEIVRRDATKAIGLGFALVVFLLVLAQGWRRALLVSLSVVLGLIWMAGAMALLGIAVNFMNLFVFVMVIGVGVDYAVHFLHREHQDQDHAVAEGTVAAIAVAALTTICGFGSLITSHFPGLRSMGATAIFGAGATALITMTLLPAWLRLRSRIS